MCSMNYKKPANIAIVCPCYNEEEILEKSAAKLDSLMSSLASEGKISSQSLVVFVNDGSVDNTWDLIKKINAKNSRFKGVDLAFNSGHQFAIMAGMMSVKDKVDAVITIDVDLQDDISCIGKMIDLYCQGNDVVYGVKVDRKGDSFIKRTTAKSFYSMQRLMGINIVDNHADFRLLSNKVIGVLSKYKESNLYLRGIIPSLGFKSATVDDKISEREAGKSKYSTKKMFKLATDGITGFSSRPLKIIFWIGVVFLIVALINAIDVVISLCNGTAAPGWSQLMLSVWFIGGVVLISLGLVGIYIGRTYSEVKQRPTYIVSEIID